MGVVRGEAVPASAQPSFPVFTVSYRDFALSGGLLCLQTRLLVIDSVTCLVWLSCAEKEQGRAGKTPHAGNLVDRITEIDSAVEDGYLSLAGRYVTAVRTSNSGHIHRYLS